MAAPPPPRPLPDLMPELIGEILVHFPPDEPAWQLRASLVCKPWRRLLCDPAFRRRYVAFNQAPPLLGFLHNWHPTSYPELARLRFVSTTTPSALPLQAFNDCIYGWRILDCRHGRVLLKTPDPKSHGRVQIMGLKLSTNLVVWDCATGKKKQLPVPPFPQREEDYTAAVLCAVRGCDHLDCHSGPFLVVFVGFNRKAGGLQSHLYSSETTTWSSSADPGPHLLTVRKPSVLIGDDIYFPLALQSVAILKVDLGKNHLSIINHPGPNAQDFKGNTVLMALEDGSLGFAAILGSKLCLWSRNDKNSEVGGEWAQCMVIDLQTLIPFKHMLRVVGSKEGSSIIFVASDIGVFSLDHKSGSGHGTKVDEPREDFAIFPFVSFYTPDGARCKLRLPMGPH